MKDIEKARQLFEDAGLPFPTIPEELAAGLKERSRWVFSTRPIDTSPYDLQHYIDEDGTTAEDYAVLSHSGHGANSYAIQYYLVKRNLRMFLHLGWGGAYMDANAAAAQIRDCFLIADKIVTSARTVARLQTREQLTVAVSDFYGSYWLPPGRSCCGNDGACKNPLDLKPEEALTESLDWLTSHQGGSNTSS